MKYSSMISKSVRYALATGAATALTVPAVAFAQSAAPGATTAAQPATTQLSKVEVTGTRILRTSVETAQPVTIITAQQLKATGLTSIGDVISQLTQTGGYAENATFNNDQTLPTGRRTINLRFLGSNRLLVLVNGHRWISQPDGAVDMNTMPVAMVDHIEILQDGASAIYGSSAIAGVVNIITIKNFSGAEAHAYMGMYDGHGDGGGWDGKAQEYDFTTGMSQGKAGAVLSVSYVNDAPVSAGSRTMSKEPIWGEGKFTGSSTTPDGRFRLRGPALAGKTLGEATCNPWDPAKTAAGEQGYQGTCDMTLITPGQFNPTTGNFRNFTPTDYYNYAPANYLLTPSERTGVYAAGHYNISDNLTFTSDVVYSNRHSQELLAPNLIGSGLPGPTSKVKGQGIGANNPFNPFGINLVANLSQYCPTNGNVQPCSNEVVQGIGRRLVEGGPRNFTEDVNTYMFRSGLNGYFNAFGNEYDWDVGYVYGQNKEIDQFVNSNNSQNNPIALDSPGFTQCSQVEQCVPLNLFGGPPSITPAMLQYLTIPSTSTVNSKIRDYSANITGTAFNLPAGPLSIAAGAEYFEQEMQQQPDSLSESTSGGLVVATAGKERTNAEYIEFNIPLVTDVPFMKNVSLDLANRWSQFRWAGGTLGNPDFGQAHFQHASTGRAALRWQATTDLLLRGSWSQGFRAPSLSDLYAGLTGGTPTVQDPCAGPPNGSWSGSGPLPPGCGFAHTQANAQIGSQLGGNPDLIPETSISKTVGFVYNPNWLPGFDISADYYAIRLQHEITKISAQAIVNSCYIAQNTGACKLIKLSRLGDSIGTIEDLNLNIGGIHTSGLDVSAHYKFPTTPIGDFKLGLSWSFLRSYVQTVPNSASPSGFSSTELAGTTTSFSGMPKQRATLTTDWNYGNWSAHWDMRYIHSMYEGCTDLSISLGFCSNPTDFYSPTGGTGRNHIGGTVFNDASVTYHVGAWNTDLTFGARNILDKQVPAALTVFANSEMNSYYGVPGRFFYARVGVKF